MLFEIAVPVRPVWPEGSPCYAHTPNDAGRWHSFTDHGRSVGNLAAEFAEPFGGGSLARFLGQTHDVGKLAAEVQEALRERARDGKPRLGVKHKVEGAALAWLLAADPIAARIAHLANYGHHSGIPAMSGQPGTPGTQQVFLEYSDAPDRLNDLIEVADRELGLDLRAVARSVQVPDFLRVSDANTRRYRMDVFTRMVHSALVDADFLDTAAHFGDLPGPRRHPTLGMRALRDHFMAWYEKRYAEASRDGINALRRAVFDSCVSVGSDAELARERRFYRLSAQTGSGKTLAAAAFALNHAAECGKRRVIVAVPFTSITTQNAAEYREAFIALGSDIVLEHHSNISEENDEGTWRRLSAENWDAEFIVTTTVQLFESLFSGRPAAARKLHRLADSVLVIDEVQALPLLLVPSILRMLQELVAHYGVSVLLASATQPSFWDLRVWRELDPPVDILPRDSVPEVTRRVTYEVREAERSWDEIADELAELPTVLAIVNTTSDAQQLHALLTERLGSGEVLHLSTRMCNEHRRVVLDQVRTALAEGRPVRLVSTQMIEAGVDVDFPVVYRALGPADSIVQSAGRCNREGLLGVLGGRVVVFRPIGGGVPRGLYVNATNLTHRLFVKQRNTHALGEPASMDLFYRELLVSHVDGSDISEKVDEARRELDFPAVSNEFRMIDEQSAPVVVTVYGSDEDRGTVVALIEGLAVDRTRILRPSERRLLQRFSASVPQRRRPELAIEMAPGIWQWAGTYDEQCGAVLAPDASIW